MNFEQLMQKMKDIDEGQSLPIAPTKDDQPGVDECGMMPMSMPSMPPKQPDNVDMNVTMHGQGPGGIKDLMQILRNIENSDNANPHSHDVGALFGGPDMAGGIDVVVDDGYENSPVGASGPEVFGIDAVTQTGDDLASKGAERPKVNGGGNPMQEALVSRLSQLYQEIKEQKTTEAAKWRDAKHKDKLYTQEPRDYDQYDYHDTDYYNGPKPDDYPGEKNLKGGGEFDHSDPLRKGYGRGGTGSTNTHGKRKGLPSRDHVSSLKGSIKSAHGTHPRPNLPE